MKWFARVIGLLVLSACMPLGHECLATIYLVGAQEYQANSGTGSANGGTQHSTNSQTFPHGSMFLNNGGPSQDLDIVFALADGGNSFTIFNPSSNFGIMGLNLFFSTTATAHSPTSMQPLLGTTLTVFGVGDSGTFATPTSGTSILAYNSPGFSGATTSANGLSSLTLDGKTVSISSWSFPTLGTGATFTIQISAVPEAGSLSLVGAALIAAAGWRRMRRGGESAR